MQLEELIEAVNLLAVSVANNRKLRPIYNENDILDSREVAELLHVEPKANGSIDLTPYLDNGLPVFNIGKNLFIYGEVIKWLKRHNKTRVAADELAASAVIDRYITATKRRRRTNG